MFLRLFWGIDGAMDLAAPKIGIQLLHASLVLALGIWSLISRPAFLLCHCFAPVSPHGFDIIYTHMWVYHIEWLLCYSIYEDYWWQ
jgi:hypothetical protein